MNKPCPFCSGKPNVYYESNGVGVEESMLRQKLIADAYLENANLQLKELKENIIMLIGFIKTGQNAKAHLQMLVVETLLESNPSPSEVSVTQDVLINSKTPLSVENDESRKDADV